MVSDKSGSSPTPVHCEFHIIVASIAKIHACMHIHAHTQPYACTHAHVHTQRAGKPYHTDLWMVRYNCPWNQTPYDGECRGGSSSAPTGGGGCVCQECNRKRQSAQKAVICRLSILRAIPPPPPLPPVTFQSRSPDYIWGRIGSRWSRLVTFGPDRVFLWIWLARVAVQLHQWLDAEFMEGLCNSSVVVTWSPAVRPPPPLLPRTPPPPPPPGIARYRTPYETASSECRWASWSAASVVT